MFVPYLSYYFDFGYTFSSFSFHFLYYPTQIWTSHETNEAYIYIWIHNFIILKKVLQIVKASVLRKAASASPN